MTALEKLGEFVADYVPDERACADARLHAADAVGAWIAATATEEGRLLLTFRQQGAALPDQISSVASEIPLRPMDCPSRR